MGKVLQPKPSGPVSPSMIATWLSEMGARGVTDQHQMLLKQVAWVLNDPPTLGVWRRQLAKLRN